MVGAGASDVILNVIYDASAANAPADFKAAVASAVAFFQNNFTDAVTLNIAVGWGEVNGQALSPGALGENISFISNYSYTDLRAALTAHATSAIDASAVASLPATDPTGGGFLWAPQGEAKALGLPTGGGLDGFVGFRSTANTFDFDESDGVTAGRYDFFSVFVHEITEIMGRQMLDGQTVGGQANSYEPLDLFHFSASGVRIFAGGVAGYFSADNGVTNIDNFNTLAGGDFGDWAASAGQDSFLAFSSSGVINAVTAADMKMMDVLGWNIAVLPTSPWACPTFSGSTVSFTVSNTGAASAAASTAGIYLSTNASVTTADTLAGHVRDARAGLAGERQRVRFDRLPDQPAGGDLLHRRDRRPCRAGHGVQREQRRLGRSSRSPRQRLHDTLVGSSANNLLVGQGGDDSLNGGSGSDTMIGGTGNDTYVVDQSTDVVTENPGEGTDTVLSSVTYALPANVENLTLTGPRRSTGPATPTAT